MRDTIHEPAGAGPWPTPNRPGSLAGGTARPWQWTMEGALEELKGRMLREIIAGVMTPALVAPLRRAANEAAAIAWLEPWPLLVFPGLFEEKVARARRQAHKQAIIHSRSAALLYEEAA